MAEAQLPQGLGALALTGSHSRRDLLKRTLGALPLVTLPRGLDAAAAGPDSRIAGVQIGIIAPYAFRGSARSAHEILEGLLDLGISAVEMQETPVEQFAGAPEGGWRGSMAGGPAPGQTGPPRRRTLTPEQQAARRAWEERMRDFRLAAPMDRFVALRQLYADAGVGIYAFKLALTETMPDAEYDYCFNVAKALGASHVTMELSENTARIGQFAAKHELRVGYHNHTQVDEHSWDAALAQSRYNCINFDIGHFTAAIGRSPIPFIEKHHARITSMHLKDRKYGVDSPNVPWGEGDTPLREVLRLMKRERYPFPATIELEYPVPEGSTVMAELRRCRRFCEEALGQV